MTGVRISYNKVKTTGRMLIGRQILEFDHPARLDTGVPGAGVQFDSVALGQQVGEEGRVTSQSTGVELVATLMAENDFDIFCLVHVVWQGVVGYRRLDGISAHSKRRVLEAQCDKQRVDICKAITAVSNQWTQMFVEWRVWWSVGEDR